jgi:hypothetical protein
MMTVPGTRKEGMAPVPTNALEMQQNHADQNPLETNNDPAVGSGSLGRG